MYTIRVIPVARGVFKDELTFFSREPFPEGAVVSANVRGRSIPALVISSQDVREEKANIRSAGFALKKIATGHGKPVLSRAFVRAVRDTALWHASHESAILSALTSSAILGAYGKLEAPPLAPRASGKAAARADLLVLQAEYEERVRTYRNLAREAFARGASLVVVAPTVVEAERLAASLERGIEDRVLLFTGDVPKRRLIASWNRAAAGNEPVLIVGTAVALSVPREDADTIVLERESARAYRLVQRPHADIRRAAEYLACAKGARLILADFPLRVETRFRVEAGEMEELARPQSRAAGAAEVRVLDARAPSAERASPNARQNPRAKRAFSMLSEETLRAIGAELARGGRAVVFSARRGIAPLTVCNDCGTPVSDKETGTPMTLHKTGSGNVFLSHRSGAFLPAGAPCHTCGGWNLSTLGIGVEGVFDELKKRFPDAPLELFTKETAPTHTRAKKLSNKFFSTAGAVLIGTERMLPYLAESVELSAVASVDAFLSLPAWRAHEHTLSVLFYLRERAELSLIVETRKPDHLVMRTLASGNPLDFYRADIAERGRYGYPPFSTFVGLEWQGAKAAVEKHRLTVKEAFADLDLVGPLPAFAEGRDLWKARAVIRVPAAAASAKAGAQSAWPDPALVERLKALPPGIAVTIDPDEIA